MVDAAVDDSNLLGGNAETFDHTLPRVLRDGDQMICALQSCHRQPVVKMIRAVGRTQLWVVTEHVGENVVNCNNDLSWGRAQEE